MRRENIEDTIAAISTPIGEGGIGIVRISGSKAIDIAQKIFTARSNKSKIRFETYRMYYGYIVNDKKTIHDTRTTIHEIIDEVILTVMRAPKSYTREDVVEINCHGGIQAMKKVLELVIKSGARMAEPGEFTKRAFLNGRIDLAQAEAVLDIIRAKTEGALKAAIDQLDGDLSKRIRSIRREAINIAAGIEASIDFPDEDIDIIKGSDLAKKTAGILSELRKMIDTFNEGLILREGVLAIICGKPNIGKSSLMNLLLKRDRVIVSPIPGTTRDAVEETINLKGIPIRLVDTAGIAKTEDIVEKEGVRRSKKYLKLADIVLLMLDASDKTDKRDLDIMKLAGGKKKLVILNKIDLPKKIDEEALAPILKDAVMVKISVKKKKGIELLEKKIVEMIWGGGYIQGEGALVSNIRHKELLDKAYGCMLSVDKALTNEAPPETIAVDLKEAIFNLGLIVGESISDDILDRIFEQFCIGK